MTAEPNSPGPANSPQTPASLQGQAQPSPQHDDAIPGSGSGGPATASAKYNFDARRWTLSDKIAGGASLVVLISLFLPWFSGSYVSFDSTQSASESGTDAHGWLWLVFVVVLAILAYLVVAAGFQVLPFKSPLRHDQLLLAATGVNLVLVFIGFLLKPSTYGLEGLSISWSFGAFLALIAAIVAVGAITPPGRRRLDSGSPAAGQLQACANAQMCRQALATWLCKAVTMRCCCAKRALLRMTGATFATVLALSGCGGTNGANTDRSPATRVTVTVTATTTATASPNPSVASSSSNPSMPSSSSPSPSFPGETSYYLADFNPVQTYGINVDTTPHTVNGVTYDHPVSWSPGFSGNPYWAEWDLSRQCTWLTSPGVGLADDAPSGATAIFYVQTDGTYRWQKTISLGQSDGLKVSIKGALRLRLTVRDVQNSVGDSYATWGDAEVWCSAQPPNSTNSNS
jgi:hypothetical protein